MGVETDLATESRTRKLLDSFDRTADATQGFVARTYGASFADMLRSETRSEYEELIPHIPRIQSRLGFALNSFLTITAQEIAVYKAMKRHGKSVDEAWELCHAGLRLRMARYSPLRRWLLSRMMSSRLVSRRMRQQAESGASRSVGGFEVRYVIGDGNEFDWGVDYVRCGNYQLVVDQGAGEFAPYVCMSDIALGDALGWGLIRTHTIADGCDSCDFRFKKGAKTRISSKTPAVQGTIERIAKKEKMGEKWS